jgi:hypothetical protein
MECCYNSLTIGFMSLLKAVGELIKPCPACGGPFKGWTPFTWVLWYINFSVSLPFYGNLYLFRVWNNFDQVTLWNSHLKLINIIPLLFCYGFYFLYSLIYRLFFIFFCIRTCSINLIIQLEIVIGLFFIKICGIIWRSFSLLMNFYLFSQWTELDPYLFIITRRLT